MKTGIVVLTYVEYFILREWYIIHFASELKVSDLDVNYISSLSFFFFSTLQSGSFISFFCTFGHEFVWTFGFLFLLVVLLYPLKEAVSALRVLEVLTLCIDPLGQNLSLNLLVYNDARDILGDTVDSSSFAVIKHIWGVPFWIQLIPLMSTISLFL